MSDRPLALATTQAREGAIWARGRASGHGHGADHRSGLHSGSVAAGAAMPSYAARNRPSVFELRLFKLRQNFFMHILIDRFRKRLSATERNTLLGRDIGVPNAVRGVGVLKNGGAIVGPDFPSNTRHDFQKMSISC